MPRTKKPTTRRRTRGEGTLYEKTRTWKSGGKTHKRSMWVAAISEGRVTEGATSRRQRKFFYGATAAEARAARDKYLTETTGKTPEPEVDGTTVAEYALHFFKHNKRHTRATTQRSYEQTLRLHILPGIGKIRLADLSSTHIKSLYDALSTKVSRSMQARVHVVLRAMLNLAREERVIETSPLETMKKSAPRNRRPPIEALTEKEVAKLLKAASTHRLEALIILALTAGLRQGELFALRWSDVDLARRTLSVVRSAQEIDGEITFVEPKTDSSRRRVTLARVAVAALKKRRTIARAEGHESELVFPSPRGDVLRKSNFIRRDWGPLRDTAGIPTARFHDLRHTAASLLLSEGVNPKIVQEMLGHASIRLTLDTYSHLIPTMQAGAAAAFDRVIWKFKNAYGTGRANRGKA